MTMPAAMSLDLLLFVAPSWPLLLGLLGSLPACRRQALRLLPLAPLPALALALIPQPLALDLPGLLLGVQLELTEGARWWLAMTSLVWFLAACFAQLDPACQRKPAILTGFWCLTLSGNIGVFLAADVVTFYVAFAVVSLASYALVVHQGNADALRAGRVYLCMAVLGEAALLAGLMMGAAGAESVRIVEVRAALASLELGPMVIVLLLVGFGIKAGLLPLHLWLPLAHPAAPTPASAVLLGAIVKAGIGGCLLFLGAADGGLAVGLAVLGMTGAFLAALLGLTQRHPKVILAYSTVSQMSLLVGMIALMAATPAAHSALVLYGVHHGLAKAALFLGVGWIVTVAPRWRRAAQLCIGLAALSIAGLPFTGGGLVKLAAKGVLPAPFDTIMSWSAITTAMLLAWFLYRLDTHAAAAGEQQASHSARARPRAWVACCRHAPVPLLLVAATALSWLGWPQASQHPYAYLLRWDNVWSLLWPVLVGVLLAGGVRRHESKLPSVPAGDILPWVWRGILACLAPVQRIGHWLQQPDQWRRPFMRQIDRWLAADVYWLARREEGMKPWQRSARRTLWVLGVLWLALTHR